MRLVNSQILTPLSSIVFITLFVTINLWSQSTLPLINTGELVVNNEENLLDQEQYKHVTEIYQNLVSARGDYRYPVPKLTMKDVEGMVAKINYFDVTITLEKKAYDVCMKIGDEAIAFLLGHELTHYYEKHAWRSGFATDNMDLKLGKSLRDLQDQVAHESEADYLGGFLAYTAGYGLFDKGDQLISNLYSAYNLKDTLKGYPSKQDRIELSKRSAKKLESLVHIFETGNYLTATGSLSDAREYYLYILKYYQSREIYNNLGLVYMMSALEDINPKEMKWKYPMQLDVNFRGTRDVSEKEQAKKEKRIKEALRLAILNFNSAINLDNNYTAAYLNKSIAYALLNEDDKASFYLLKEAKPIALKDSILNAKILSDIKVVEGILLAKKGEKDKSKKAFKNAQSISNTTASFNLSVLEGLETSSPPSSNSTSKFTLANDPIGSGHIKDYIDDPSADDEPVVKFSSDLSFFKFTADDNNSVYYVNMDESKDDTVLKAFQSTSEDYKGQTKTGSKIGDDSSDVLLKHGLPDKRLDTPEGELLIYEDVIFVIGGNNKLKKWVTYKKGTL